VFSLKRRITIFSLDGREFSLQNFHKKVATAARGLKEASINTFALFLDKVKHVLNKPCGSKHLSMVSHSLL
jgi:hypothetical protein